MDGQNSSGPDAAAVAPQAPDTQAPAAPSGPAAPTQHMAPDVKAWWTQRQQELAEKDQTHAAEVAELQKYKDTFLRMASHANYGNAVLDFMEGKPAPTTGPALQQPAAQHPGHGAEDDTVEPEIRGYVENTILNAVQRLKAEIGNAMVPHIRRLERLNADAMLSAAKSKYPDIDKYAPQIKDMIAKHPTMDPIMAYRNVAWENAMQAQDAKGFERGVQQGRFDAFDPMTVGRGAEVPEEGITQDVQKKIDASMASGNTYDAVLTALQAAKQLHMT